jgi:hypothetical protein
MTTLVNDKYQHLAAEFQRQQILMLKKTLEKYAVQPELAKNICGDFTFDLSIMLDQGEIELDGEAFRPGIAFTADEEDYYVQPADVEYHEYAYGTTSEIFEK